MVIESAANTKNRNNKSYHYYYFPLYNLAIFLLTPLVNVIQNMFLLAAFYISFIASQLG